MPEYKTDSMYRNTGVVDNKYLDIMEPVFASINSGDTKTITLESKYEKRPDKLAYDLYGNAKLWWIFAEYNQDTLKDPIVDFKSGLEIRVPKQFT